MSVVPSARVATWWRRRRFAVALVAVLLVLLAGIGYLLAGVSVGGGAPGDAVTAYLQALARGDAEAALATGTAPPDRSLLTDQVLAGQRRLAPISDIAVTGTDSGDYGAVVRASYRIGDRQVEDHFNTVRVDGNWRLASVAVDVEVSGGAALPGLQVFGVTASPGRDLYLFPGAVQFRSADPDLTIVPSGAMFTTPDVPALITLGTSLTAAGQQSGTAAITSALGDCAASTSLAPAGCPQSAPPPAGAVAYSWSWSLTAVRDVSFTPVPRVPRSFTVSATAVWELHYQVLTDGQPTAASLSRTTPIAGTLDYAANPVSFTLARGTS